MSRRYITVAAILVVALSMVAVWGVGDGRQTAVSASQSGAVPPTAASPPPTQPAAKEPSRATTAPTTAATTGQGAQAAANGSSTAAASTATRTPGPDYDGDGIPDAQDVCPTRPETFNGFKDGDGCPDVVTTTRAS